jgi:hypothetical protein
MKILFTLHSPEDLKVVADMLKVGAEPDDTLDSYSKTKEEADRVRRLEGFTDEQREQVANTKGGCAIILDNKVFSLMMSHDANHNYQWHLSACQVVGPGKLGPMSDDYTKRIMDAFFSSWKEVPNPGQMSEVRHFVGND